MDMIALSRIKMDNNKHENDDGYSECEKDG